MTKSLESHLDSLKLNSTTPCKKQLRDSAVPNSLVTSSSSPRTPHVKIVDVGKQRMMSQLSRTSHFKENLNNNSFKKPSLDEKSSSKNFELKLKDAEKKYLKEVKLRLDGEKFFIFLTKWKWSYVF